MKQPVCTDKKARDDIEHHRRANHLLRLDINKVAKTLKVEREMLRELTEQPYEGVA